MSATGPSRLAARHPFPAVSLRMSCVRLRVPLVSAWNVQLPVVMRFLKPLDAL